MNTYTKDQITGMFWFGVSLGKAQETAVENITTKTLEDNLAKYLSDLDALTPISPSPMTRGETIKGALDWLKAHMEDWEESVDYTAMAELMADFALSLSIHKVEVTDEEITKAADTKFPTDNENTALGQTFAVKQQYGSEVGARWMRSRLIKEETK